MWIVIIVVVALIFGYWYLNSTSSITSNQPNNTTGESSNKSINSFIFPGLSPEADGAIDNAGYTVNLLVPNGTDLTNLVPTISISDGTTISPSSGTAEDFTNPVTYTVTAQDGSTQNYTVTVMTADQSSDSDSSYTAQSPSNSINSFTLSGLNPSVNGVIDNNAYTVNLTVPNGTDLTNLVPTITVSDNATIYPASGTAEDFTNPVTYTVTAQDGLTQNYIVTATTGIQ